MQLALLLVVPATLPAQLRIGATAGTLAFAGASTTTNPTDPSTARPHGSYALGAAGSLQRGGWLVRVGIATLEPGVLIGDDDVHAGIRSALSLLLVEPALARRLATAREGGTLWLEAGPSIQRWSPLGADARTRVGGAAALVWRQRALRRVELSIRAHVSASPSPFDQPDLPPDMRPATLWSRGVSLEMSWRL